MADGSAFRSDRRALHPSLLDARASVRALNHAGHGDRRNEACGALRLPQRVFFAVDQSPQPVNDEEPV